MKTFKELEQSCEVNFLYGGRYWHAYTDGRHTSLLFADDCDYRFGMNVIAQAAFAVPYVRLITFAVMSNHFHFVVMADSEDEIVLFYKSVRRRLGHSIQAIKDVDISLKEIVSLQSLRNTIAYVNRNGFVADVNYTPFTYPWGCNRHFFQTLFKEQFYKDLSYRVRESLFRGRAPKLPDDWWLTDGYIAPPCYCKVAFGMAMFRGAHHYYYQISKNVESYSGIADEIDDGEYLTDSEMFETVMRIVRNDYGLNAVRDMSSAQKNDLARRLRKEFRSSNGQISRMLGLRLYEVDKMFPLSAKK